MNRRQFLYSPLAASPMLAAQSAEEGFVPLFDGKSLRGWAVKEGPESCYYADKGQITKVIDSETSAWLRSERQYENFDFRCEFLLEGWAEGGIILHAPEHGRAPSIGQEFKIFLLVDKLPMNNSMGSIFPIVAPKLINVRRDGAWNPVRILMDWPRLQAWVNDEMVQDVDLESVPELRWRLRRGYLGLTSVSYGPVRFRNVRIKELPDREQWIKLYETDEDFEKNWFYSDRDPKNPPKFDLLNGILRTEGWGHIATKEKFRDFQLQCYIREAMDHNGGVLFRTEGKGLRGRHYEVQLQPVEDAHYPTGSLYNYKRCIYPRIENEKWYLMQVVVQGKNCLVRINGDDVLEYDRLEHTDEGHIELQAHRSVRWAEFSSTCG